MPDHTTLNDLERLVRVQTQHQINERLLVLAQSKNLTHGYKPRLDASVTETNIRYPTDSGLLVDGVRLLSRWLNCTTPMLSSALRGHGVCRNRVRGAGRRARLVRRRSRSNPKQEGQRPAPFQGRQTRKELYAELIQIASSTLDQVGQATEQLSRQKDRNASQVLALGLNELRPLFKRVIDQATWRVLQGETLPAQEKVASLWEPHTQIIRRGKPEPHESHHVFLFHLARYP